MASPSQIKSLNETLAQSRPLVAVFAGGTSGIGEYTVRTLASHYATSPHSLRTYIVGRNAVAAEKTISDCQRMCPKGEFLFVKVDDLSLLKIVDRCCAEITGLEEEKCGEGEVARVDLLVMTFADLHFGGRRETSEGLDKSLALKYYSRMRFITSLLPLLLASHTPAHIISIYAAGTEKNLPSWSPTDFSLRNPANYSLTAYRTHACVFTTFFFEQLAREYAGKLSLVHMFPGLVITPAFDQREGWPVWLRVMFPVLRPILSGIVATGSEEIGERILGLMRFEAAGEAGKKSGAYSVGRKGEIIGDFEKTYEGLRKDGFAEKVRVHTEGVFEAVAKGSVFEG